MILRVQPQCRIQDAPQALHVQIVSTRDQTAKRRLALEGAELNRPKTPPHAVLRFCSAPDVQARSQGFPFPPNPTAVPEMHDVVEAVPTDLPRLGPGF